MISPSFPPNTPHCGAAGGQHGKDIKQMVISDIWGSTSENYTEYDYKGTEGVEGVDLSSKPDPAKFFVKWLLILFLILWQI